MKNSKPWPLPLLISFCGMGAAADFLCNGVLRMGTIAIYGPVLLGVAATLASFLHKSRWKKAEGPAVAAFLAGALAAHFGLAGRKQTRLARLSITGRAPIALRSPDWPLSLVVTSEKLEQELSRHPARAEGVPVVFRLVTDYGCIRTFRVESVAGIDVESDPDAAWTLRVDPGVKTGADNDPTLADQRLPWCWKSGS